jgi:hypothetical protein
MVTTVGDQRPFASNIEHLAKVLHGIDSERCGTAGLRRLLDQASPATRLIASSYTSLASRRTLRRMPSTQKSHRRCRLTNAH